jgi:hypothetical protein
MSASTRKPSGHTDAVLETAGVSRTNEGYTAGAPLEDGDYNVVVKVVAGRLWKGRIGYVDEDGVWDGHPGKAITYFEEPLVGNYTYVPYKYLRVASQQECADYFATHANEVSMQAAAAASLRGRANRRAK